MLTANELRIGNWVYYNPAAYVKALTSAPQPLRVTRIGRDRYGYQANNPLHTVELEDMLLPANVPYCSYEHSEGIPLTPELLIKCGFVQKSRELSYEMPSELIDLGWTEKQGLYFDINLGEYTNEIKNVRYLHQLQNLFFSLTGEELQISL